MSKLTKSEWVFVAVLGAFSILNLASMAHMLLLWQKTSAVIAVNPEAKRIGLFIPLSPVLLNTISILGLLAMGLGFYLRSATLWAFAVAFLLLSPIVFSIAALPNSINLIGFLTIAPFLVFFLPDIGLRFNLAKVTTPHLVLVTVLFLALAITIHQICRTYIESSQVVFANKLKELKPELFGGK